MFNLAADSGKINWLSLSMVVAGGGIGIGLALGVVSLLLFGLGTMAAKRASKDVVLHSSSWQMAARSMGLCSGLSWPPQAKKEQSTSAACCIKTQSSCVVAYHGHK